MSESSPNGTLHVVLTAPNMRKLINTCLDVCEQCYKHNKPFLVKNHEGLLVVGFHENADHDSLWDKIRCWRTKGMHSGLFNDFALLEPRVLNQLHAHFDGDMSRRVVVTGHGKGGGLAQLFALHYHLYCSHLITFGSIKVFSKEKARVLSGLMIDQVILRYQQEDNPMACSPPKWAGYSHLGDQWLLVDELSQFFDIDQDYQVSGYREAIERNFAYLEKLGIVDLDQITQMSD